MIGGENCDGVTYGCIDDAQSERADAGDRGEVQMKGRYSYPKTDTEGGTITTTYFMKPIR